MRLLIHNKPKLKMPEFKVDEPLSKHLEDDPLLSNMNKSFCCGLIGKAGSGKTSLMVSFLQTPKKFKKVFNKIYVFMPNSSRNSMKKDIYLMFYLKTNYLRVSVMKFYQMYMKDY